MVLKRGKKFFKTMNDIVESDKLTEEEKKDAYMIKILALFGFALGDRIGETRALTWDCIDYENCKVYIKHSIQYDPNKMKEKKHIVKKDETVISIANYYSINSSDIAKRNKIDLNTKLNVNQTIIIPAEYLKETKNYWSSDYVNISKKHCEEIRKYKAFLEKNIDEKLNDIIFWNYRYNKIYSDVSLRKKFYKCCELANVTKIRLYDLRHTFVATMMAEGKELYEIMDNTRHKSYKTTVDNYGHIADSIKRNITATTDKYF